jgi:hypothetical protein
MCPSAEDMRAELERAGVLDSMDQPDELGHRESREARARRGRCRLSTRSRSGCASPSERDPKQPLRCAAVDRIGCTRGSVLADVARPAGACATGSRADRGLPVVAQSGYAAAVTSVGVEE